jgi:hypothetical protein
MISEQMVDYRALKRLLPEPPSTSDILKDRFDRQHVFAHIRGVKSAISAAVAVCLLKQCCCNLPPPLSCKLTKY